MDAMALYMFPVRIENGNATFLPHVAAEIPALNISSLDEIPDEIKPILKKLHPNKEISEYDDFADVLDALSFNTGIIVREYDLGNPGWPFFTALHGNWIS